MTDPHLIAQTIWSIVHGVLRYELLKGHDQWIDWAGLQQQPTKLWMVCCVVSFMIHLGSINQFLNCQLRFRFLRHYHRVLIMYWIALRMLMGDTTKYLGLIFGVTFATHLMSQHGFHFYGNYESNRKMQFWMSRCFIWVMDSKVRFVDEAPPLPNTDLFRVRGVPGVDWAVRMYKGQIRARLEDGGVRNVYLTGLDDDTLVGLPQTILLGNLRDLQQPDAVIIGQFGFEWMWPNEPLTLGKDV